jgi:hypothetical protein
MCTPIDRANKFQFFEIVFQRRLFNFGVLPFLASYQMCTTLKPTSFSFLKLHFNVGYSTLDSCLFWLYLVNK